MWGLECEVQSSMDRKGHFDLWALGAAIYFEIVSLGI